jgi:hypothetical protein
MGPGNLTRVGWLKKACGNNQTLALTPSQVSPLPYGFGTLDLEDFKFPNSSTTKFQNEKR